MRGCDLGGLTLAMLLALGVPQLVSATTEDEADCCLIMTKFADKYWAKHVKIVNKCTNKMENSSDPNSEKCDDGFDRVLALNSDFAIDKFSEKFFAKMKKKCMKKLGLTNDVEFQLRDSLTCADCKSQPKLPLQMDCLLEAEAVGADSGICDLPPVLKNANRGASAPPGESTFCNDPNLP